MLSRLIRSWCCALLTWWSPAWLLERCGSKRGEGPTGRTRDPPGPRAFTVAVRSRAPTAAAARAGFACVNLDWWPASKCDYGRCPWGSAGLLSLDLRAPALVAAVRALAGASPPLTVRVGGGLSDVVSYNASAGDGGRCGAFAPDNGTRLGYDLRGPCMQMDTWAELHELCSSTGGCRVAFALNGLAGRKLRWRCPNGTDCRQNPPSPCCTSWEGTWDPSNALSLMRYSRAAGITPFAFELGNEIAGPMGIEATDILADRYAGDLDTLAAAIASVWGDKPVAERPRLVAYDSAFNGTYITELLRTTSSVDILTTHAYILGPGVDPRAFDRATDPAVLDRQRSEYAATAAALRAAASRAEPWVGEAGGAYNSGAPGTTDAFVSAFWYLDSLAAAAAEGFGGWCRQTLVGGSYGLLSREDLSPNPDFYAALLWRRLMGPRVLAASVAAGDGEDSGLAASPSLPKLRAYAHCAAARGGVALLLLNLDANASAVVTAGDGSPRSWLPGAARREWVATAAPDGPRAGAVVINGARATGTALPPPAQREAGASMLLPPLSYAFVHIPGAAAAACVGE